MNTTVAIRDKLPFRKSVLVRTERLDELEEKVYSRVDPRKTQFVSPRSSTDILITNFALNHSLYFGVSHQAPIRTRSAQELTAMQISIPLSGCLKARRRNEETCVCPGEVYVNLPGDELDIEWRADTRAIVMIIDARHFDNFLNRTFDTQLNLLRSERRSFALNNNYSLGLANALSLMFLETENPDSVLFDPAMSDGFENFMFSNICNLLVGNKLRPSLPMGGMGMPGYVKRVVDYIEEHCDQSLDISDLVSVANVSLRSLQGGFAKHFDKGPMTFLRHTRLQKVRKALLQADPERTKIIDVAVNWGFNHQSHFARLYFQHFGELPSETIRKSG